MASTQIFEDPEPVSITRSHKKTSSLGDVLRGRRKNVSPTKTEQNNRNVHVSPIKTEQNNRNVHASPLGERHINSPPQPKKVPLKNKSDSRPAMHKKTGSTASLKDFLRGRDKDTGDDRRVDKGEPSPKKTKSSTNLAGLLKKKSKKDLKENVVPINKHGLMSAGSNTSSPQLGSAPRLPALYTTTNDRSTKKSRTIEEEIALYTPRDYSEYRPHEQRNFFDNDYQPVDLRLPQRPFLAHKSSHSSIFTENLDEEQSPKELETVDTGAQLQDNPPVAQASLKESPQIEQTSADTSRTEPAAKRSSRILDTIATLNMRVQRGGGQAPETRPSPQKNPLGSNDLDSEMENMLGRFDVPQNLRDHFRNLKPEVKVGLINGERIGSGSSLGANERKDPAGRPSKDHDRARSTDKIEKESGRSRSRSRTRSAILSISKRSDDTVDREDKPTRSRSKSRPKSIDIGRQGHVRSASSGAIQKSLATPDCAVTPGDFIHYLREVQKPELVEVGKLHKLRILLRNESIAWTDSFVKKGGMDELVQLLYRIMKLEWREEHEDNLLHETLSCLKGLSNTSLAVQRMESMSRELFPALLKMLFDPERKGPSEYGTRGIIVALIFSQLAATLHGEVQKHTEKARELSAHMRDPSSIDDKQPLEFVTQMHASRPWRNWCKEVTNVTKEVFWIFLHHYNVVPVLDKINEGEITLAQAYFPTARAPHPAAPYVGGVEWEATQYLAAHLDLLNGLIVSLPTIEERNQLRDEMRASGWEKVMGGSLRTCKEKFYSCVHDGLKAWVAAARQDDWPVEDVRAGPPREAASQKKSPSKKKGDEAPQLALNVDVPVLSSPDQGWLS